MGYLLYGRSILRQSIDNIVVPFRASRAAFEMVFLLSELGNLRGDDHAIEHTRGDSEKSESCDLSGVI